MGLNVSMTHHQHYKADDTQSDSQTCESTLWNHLKTRLPLLILGLCHHNRCNSSANEGGAHNEEDWVPYFSLHDGTVMLTNNLLAFVYLTSKNCDSSWDSTPKHDGLWSFSEGLEREGWSARTARTFGPGVGGWSGGFLAGPNGGGGGVQTGHAADGKLNASRLTEAVGQEAHYPVCHVPSAPEPSKGRPWHRRSLLRADQIYVLIVTRSSPGGLAPPRPTWDYNDNNTMGSEISSERDPFPDAPRGGTPVKQFVLRTADGKHWPLLPLVMHLYRCLPRDRHAFADAVRVALADVCRRDRVHIASDGTVVSWANPEEAGPAPRCNHRILDAPVDPTTDRRQGLTLGTLLRLERLGQRLFGGALHDRAYAAWIDADPDHTETEVAAARPVPEPSPSVLDGVVELLRRTGGPVGLVWLAPMLLALVLPTRDGKAFAAAAAVEVDAVCLDPTAASQWTPRPLLPLCDSPAGCGVQLYHYEPAVWYFFAPLITFTLRYQCQPIKEPQPCERREQPTTRGDGDLERRSFCWVPTVGMWDTDHLVVCTVGGAPMGTMIYMTGTDRLDLLTLCAVTGTRMGSVLVRHLQRVAGELNRPIELYPLSGAVPFYLQHGFTRHSEDLTLRWNPSTGTRGVPVDDDGPPTKRFRVDGHHRGGADGDAVGGSSPGSDERR
jgi:hypothetical protein